MASKKKESAAEAVAAREQFMADTRMNLDDAFMAIVNKKAGITNEPSSGKTKLIDRDNTYIAGKKVENQHVDWDTMLSKLGKTPQPVQRQRSVSSGGYVGNQNTISLALASRAIDNFQPVIDELSRFKFASSPDKREAQMSLLVMAAKEALQKVAVCEVAENTKQFYPNSFRFVQSDNGLDVYFKVAGKNVVVRAQGEFYGNEIVCLEQEAQNVTAYVAREHDGQFEDLTQNYTLKTEVVK